jgi:hypothetical protein
MKNYKIYFLLLLLSSISYSQKRYIVIENHGNNILMKNARMIQVGDTIFSSDNIIFTDQDSFIKLSSMTNKDTVTVHKYNFKYQILTISGKIYCNRLARFLKKGDKIESGDELVYKEIDAVMLVFSANIGKVRKIRYSGSIKNEKNEFYDILDSWIKADEMRLSTSENSLENSIDIIMTKNPRTGKISITGTGGPR